MISKQIKQFLFNKCLFIIFIAGILTACGSGGGSSSIEASPNPGNSSDSKPSLSVKLNSSSTVNVGDVLNGTVTLNSDNSSVFGITALITSSNTGAATVSPESCTLSTDVPTCNITVNVVGPTSTGFSINVNSDGYLEASSQTIIVNPINNNTKPGILSIKVAPESININQKAIATVTLNNATNINNLLINITSSNTYIAKINKPDNCTIKSSQIGQNSCSITLTGLKSGMVEITASATGYKSANTNIIVTDKIYAYFIDSNDNSYTKCSVELYGINSSSCVTIKPGNLFTPYGIAIQNNYVFITNSEKGDTSLQGYTNCQIDESSGLLHKCKTTTNVYNQTVNVPNGIAINNNQAYIINAGNNTYTLCNVSDGSLTDCIMSPKISEFHNLSGGIAIYNNYAYIINSSPSNSIVYCHIANDGQLESCQESIPAGLSSAEGIAINNNILYVTDLFSTTYTQCNISPNNGSPIGCFDPNNATIGPSIGISFYKNYSYLVNKSSNSYSQCSINESEILIECIKQTPVNAGALSNPTYMAFSDD